MKKFLLLALIIVTLLVGSKTTGFAGDISTTRDFESLGNGNTTLLSNSVNLNLSGYISNSDYASYGSSLSSSGYAIAYVPAPTVSLVAVPTNGTYKRGDILSFKVKYDVPVTVDITNGSPYIPITLNTGGTVNAIYTSYSGYDNSHNFKYQIVNGNFDADGISVGTAITANGGTLKSADGVDANLTLNNVASTTGVLIDAIFPWVTSISSTTANGTYKTGDNIAITISFSEAVTVTGMPTLTLNSGGTASYIFGSGTSVLTFNYTVENGQGSSDLDYSSAFGSLLLPAGTTIKDAAGNSSNLSLPTVGGASSLGGQKDIVIVIAPTVTTQAVSSIALTTATGNGNITALGIPNPTAYGICWNTTGTPTISDSKADKGAASATGAFTASMTGLTANTTYYVRAFATNAVGTSYGEQQTFKTLANAPTITSTPTLTAPYGKPYSYSIVATMEGELETTLTGPTKPAWLSFSTEGQNQASLFGNIPAGKKMSGVAGDTDGNTYAITLDGREIYKIGADGTTTLWKSGLISGQVYALHISNGYIYIPRYSNPTQSITRIPLSNPSAAEETFATLSYGALSLTDKDGWIYAADWNSAQISRINETTKVNQLLLSASNDVPSDGPFGLTFGDDGNLYIATWNNNSIIRYDGTKLLTGSPGTPTTVLSGLQNAVSSIRQDRSGYFYLSMFNGGVRKYTSDFSSFQVVSLSATDNIWSLSFTASGALVYSKYGTNEVYRLQTGAILTGTPAKSDVGDHAVVIRATNSAGYTEQSFTIKVIDNVGPVITAKAPANSATNVALQPTLSLTFDEEVSIGDAGTLSLYNGATLLKSFDLSVPAEKALVVLSENHLSLSVALTENLPVNTAMTVGVSAGFVKDVHSNNFIGFAAASNTWSFTTINKNDQTITFPAIAAKTYGDAAFALGDAKTNRDLTVTYTAEDPTVVSITGNQATILKAGSTKITATQAGDGSNFAATPVERTLKVNKAELTVTADNQKKVYGAANPTLTSQYSGWVNGAETIDTPPTISATVNGTTAVGTYADAIILSGGTDNNYTFNFVAGDFEVTKAELTVTADNQTKVYGAINPTLAFKYSGWVNGEETIDTPPTASTTVTGTSAVDTYADAITLSGGSDNNYTFKLVAGDFAITKAELTATADDQTKVYGGINPTLTFQYSGWVNGEETIDTPPTASTTVTGTSAVDTYADAITLSGGSDNNYTLKLVAGDLEVTKAELTVTADAQTKIYGQPNDVLTFQYSGWQNGDSEATLDTNPTSGTTVDQSTSVGTYSNVITVSGGLDKNYDFKYVPADFEVTKALLTIEAEAQNKAYDGTNSATLTEAKLVGILNGDNVALNIGSAYFENKNAGNDKVITVTGSSISGADAENYTLKEVSGLKANIIPKQLTITNTSVVTNKMFDNATTAIVENAGTLQGLVSADASSVAVSAIANYNSAAVGKDKVITTVFTISGSAASNYIKPVDLILTDAKISDKVILSETIDVPVLGECRGENLFIGYQILKGTPTDYRITFNAAALAAGFENIGYLPLTSTQNQDQLYIHVPANMVEGVYTANLQFRNELNNESPIYPFEFTIKLSKDYIVKKFDDVILCDNSSNRFTAYQWYKNGQLIPGATGQFYNEKSGLDGFYSLQATTKEGAILWSCEQEIHSPKVKNATISAYPNPAVSSEPFTVKVTDLNDQDLKGAVMRIYNIQGTLVQTINEVRQVNSVKLPFGEYIGTVITSDQKRFTYKITVVNF